MHEKLFIGIVKEVLDDQNFNIVLADGAQVLVSLSAKMKGNMLIGINEGDEVAVELSPFDKTRGRISYKHAVMNKYFGKKKT